MVVQLYILGLCAVSDALGSVVQVSPCGLQAVTSDCPIAHTESCLPHGRSARGTTFQQQSVDLRAWGDALLDQLSASSSPCITAQCGILQVLQPLLEDRSWPGRDSADAPSSAVKAILMIISALH